MDQSETVIKVAEKQRIFCVNKVSILYFPEKKNWTEFASCKYLCFKRLVYVRLGPLGLNLVLGHNKKKKKEENNEGRRTRRKKDEEVQEIKEEGEEAEKELGFEEDEIIVVV